jgi:hypothetical protein
LDFFDQELEIFAARCFDIPFLRKASYVLGFFTDGPGFFSHGMKFRTQVNGARGRVAV